MIRASLALALLALLPAPARADERCGTYPDAIHDQVYAGYADCTLKGFGAKPLWHGVTDPAYRQQIRFTFVDGHFAYVRTIDFAELADGTGMVELQTFGRRERFGELERLSRKHYPVSAEDVATLDRLGAESGTWNFASGTWDLTRDGEQELYLHCETLDMERIDTTGYRFASVNISCNQPDKLMPLVRHLAALAKLEPSANGRAW